jgi:hypothetical protein
VHLTESQQFRVYGTNGQPLTAQVVVVHGDDDTAYVHAFRTYASGGRTQASHLTFVPVADLPEPLRAVLS